MGTQNYGDESNWKHQPETEHYVEDKYGKGSHTRNWKKNLEEKSEDAADFSKDEEMTEKKSDTGTKSPESEKFKHS
jgi:DnaK suppressor protein